MNHSCFMISKRKKKSNRKKWNDFKTNKYQFEIWHWSICSIFGYASNLFWVKHRKNTSFINFVCKNQWLRWMRAQVNYVTIGNLIYHLFNLSFVWLIFVTVRSYRFIFQFKRFITAEKWCVLILAFDTIHSNETIIMWGDVFFPVDSNQFDSLKDFTSNCPSDHILLVRFRYVFKPFPKYW